MNAGSKALLYVFLGGPALLLGVYLFLLGPIGWFVIAFLVIAALATQSLLEDGSDRTPVRTSCPHCGAPNPIERDVCKHCDESLSDED